MTPGVEVEAAANFRGRMSGEKGFLDLDFAAGDFCINGQQLRVGRAPLRSAHMQRCMDTRHHALPVQPWLHPVSRGISPLPMPHVHDLSSSHRANWQSRRRECSSSGLRAGGTL